MAGLLSAAVSCGASAALITVDPDSFPAGTILNSAFSGVTLTALGGSNLENSNVLCQRRSNSDPLSGLNAEVKLTHLGP
jgi:hypothetical protein